MLVFPMLMLLTIMSFAQDRTPRVNERQRVQQGRIQQGKRSDELTQDETALLRKEQRHIRRSDPRTKADGDVTLNERKHLDRKQDRASRHIRRANNNEIKPN